MDVEDIRRILVVGAGTMGQQIALHCAMHGYDVTVYDRSQAALERATQQVDSFATQLVARKRLPAGDAQAAVARIGYTTDVAAGVTADLVSESVPEDPAVKASVFAQLDTVCPSRTLFTTNTSTLVPSMFAEATGRPEQFAALHFYQYVWDSNLVDIMPHPGTSPETMRLLRAFATRIGQVPLVFTKESHGYVVNAILGAMNNTAIRLVFMDGVASVEDVDRAVMIALKVPLGPFGGLDHVGLDTVWHATQVKADLTGDPHARAFADKLKAEYLDKGRLGVKSGKGFYTYPDPAYARPDFLSAPKT